MKAKLEETLKAQVNKEDLIPVEQVSGLHPYWDGGLRVCGDFKVTKNLVICSQIYPLPTPEEIFSTLANGES